MNKKKLKNPKEIRQSAYDRNLAFMRAFKETHPCKDCKRTYPHYVMHFVTPKVKGEWSIPRLAISRCSISVLDDAMRKTPLLCANCLAIRDWKNSN